LPIINEELGLFRSSRTARTFRQVSERRQRRIRFTGKRILCCSTKSLYINFSD